LTAHLVGCYYICVRLRCYRSFYHLVYHLYLPFLLYVPYLHHSVTWSFCFLHRCTVVRSFVPTCYVLFVRWFHLRLFVTAFYHLHLRLFYRYRYRLVLTLLVCSVCYVTVSLLFGSRSFVTFLHVRCRSTVYHSVTLRCCYVLPSVTFVHVQLLHHVLPFHVVVTFVPRCCSVPFTLRLRCCCCLLFTFNTYHYIDSFYIALPFLRIAPVVHHVDAVVLICSVYVPGYVYRCCSVAFVCSLLLRCSTTFDLFYIPTVR